MSKRPNLPRANPNRLVPLDAWERGFLEKVIVSYLQTYMQKPTALWEEIDHEVYENLSKLGHKVFSGPGFWPFLATMRDLEVKDGEG